MGATYTWDVFMMLDGFDSYDELGNWGGYRGEQGPELLEHRLGLYSSEHRMVFGATTMRVTGVTSVDTGRVSPAECATSPPNGCRTPMASKPAPNAPVGAHRPSCTRV